MPKIEWVAEIVAACDKAGIQVFLKDNLEPLLCDQPYAELEKSELYSAIYHDGDDLIAGVDLRQEMPDV